MSEYVKALDAFNLKMDKTKTMDIPYGNEYLEKHNVTTFRNANTIATDVRLKTLFNLIMHEAIMEEVTDIKINQEEQIGIVSFRKGRKMTPVRAIHKYAVESLITYVRVLVETNPEKTVVPVSTNHTFKFTKKNDKDEVETIDYDTRLQFHPSKYGTTLSIRVFYPANLELAIDDLGLPDVVAYKYKQVLRQREGLIALTGATGSGKQLANRTLIPTLKGFKQLGKLKLHDYILDENGNETEILEIFEHTDNKNYRFLFSDNTELFVGEDHLWEVVEQVSDRKLKKVVDTRELVKNDYYKKVFIPILSKHIDKYVLDKDTDYNNGCELVDIKSYIFKNDLQKVNYLSGIVDTFGQPNRKQNVIVLNNVFEDKRVTSNLLLIKQLINSLGQVATIEKNKLSFLPNRDYFTQNSKNKYFTYYKNQYLSILDIQEAPKEPSRCLTVDSPNHLFLCSEGFIVTHNTTTEYVGMLQLLRDSDYTSNILTIEDPIEYKIDGITQSQVDEIRGFTFAEATKSFLRMNPDVLLIGEIRDEETAKTVTRASTSGHLALTTIHANSTLEVLDVLKQYGVHENDIKNAVKLILYQTLEDKLCPHCRKQKILKPDQKNWLDRHLFTNEQLATGYERNYEGCEHCNHTGIKGRVLLCEMLESTFEFRVLKEKHGANIDELKRALINSEDRIYYPIEHDVHRAIKQGTIDFETATRLIH